MNIDTLKKIIKSINDNFLINKKIIEEAINKELENGYIVNFDNIINVLRTIRKKYYRK